MTSTMLEPHGLEQNRTYVRSSRFNYYIHDSIDACRLQLIGELTGSDLPDLQGCATTARTTLDGRLLILDTLELSSTDEAGREWLDSMLADGAKLLDKQTPRRTTVKTGWWRSRALCARQAQ